MLKQSKLFYHLRSKIITPTVLSSIVIISFLFNTPLGLCTANATIVPNFAAMSGKTRTQAFIHTLLPIIHAENRKISEQRKRLKKLANVKALNPQQKLWLKTIAATYKLPIDKRPPSNQWFIQILTRVDSLPPSLVIVQAANESGWGTSRFATQGNNYFGMWCYTSGCGLIPKNRAPGKTHEVQVFPSIQASVEAYYRNINTNAAYNRLRSIRAKERTEGIKLNSLDLLQGLVSYSERGDDYVTSLGQWIAKSDFQKYDTPIPSTQASRPPPLNQNETDSTPYYQQVVYLYHK